MSFKENIANSLTIFRILIVPFFIFTVFDVSVLSGSLALILFLLASLSDYLDGYFARKFNIHSRFGEFLDPLADKLLVGAAFICFALIPDFSIPFILIVIILIREVFITILRLVALKKGRPLKTERLGKLKTVVQMLTIIIILILHLIKKVGMSLHPEIGIKNGISGWIELFGRLPGLSMYYTPLILIAISACFALLSMIQYITRNWSVLFSTSDAP
ncbi:MAG: CDP-diacylglycerol--glycerol-3-phosphate 3-phosphatidyltransferase [Spirochaetota bacterium]|nr:MAG: CDP-diacylglycerol--glycerol-3-phosphate 3-phosphatidyltransferase [Spirochaetota bacterium]